VAVAAVCLSEIGGIVTSPAPRRTDPAMSRLGARALKAEPMCDSLPSAAKHGRNLPMLL